MSEQDDFKELSERVKNVSLPHLSTRREDEFAEVAPDSPEDPHKKALRASMWATNGREFFPTERAVEKLAPGQYTVEWSNTTGPFFSMQEINLDDLLVLPDSRSEQVLEHVSYFWQIEDKFRDLGFLWKRGILLWGPPGSGKTSTIQQLSKQIVDLGGITIYCTVPHMTAAGLSVLRRIEKNRPIVVILEDIDAIVRQHGESELLAMLDGEHQTDNVVFVATTNYPEMLDKRLINRPSRFDEVIKIGMPSAAARAFYLKTKNPRLANDQFELNEWVNITEGFSIAHLKEMIISVECFGKALQQAHDRLRAMMDATPDDFEQSHKKQSFGFSRREINVESGCDGGG